MASARRARPFPTLATGAGVLAVAGAALGAGALVNDFGQSGSGAVNFTVQGTATRAHAVVNDAAGRFVVAADTDRGEWVLGRFDLDGTPDAGFGAEGSATPGMVVDAGGSTAGAVRDLTFLPAGRVLVAGRVGTSGGGGSFAVRRYSSGGLPDPRFASNGTLTIAFGGDPEGQANAIATHTVAGDPSTATAVVAGFHSDTANGTRRPAIARFLPGGSLDARFGRGGIISNIPGAPTGEIHDVQVLADGGIVAVGDTGSAISRPLVIRLRPDGSPDTRFGEGTGVVVAPRPTDCLSASYRSVLVDAQARIVVGGSARCDGRTNSAQFLFTRYSDEGQRDVGFATIGTALLPNDGTTDRINSITAQFDGSIVGAGSTGTVVTPRPAVVRLGPDGTPDATFGQDGVASGSAVGSPVGQAEAVAIGRDGHLVTAGWATIAGSDQATVTKYDGSIAQTTPEGAATQTP